MLAPAWVLCGVHHASSYGLPHKYPQSMPSAFLKKFAVNEDRAQQDGVPQTCLFLERGEPSGISERYGVAQDEGYVFGGPKSKVYRFWGGVCIGVLFFGKLPYLEAMQGL